MQAQTITLTGNERLARHLRLAHATARQAAGETVSEPAAVWSWRGWLRAQHTLLQDAALAGEADAPPVLLSATQARVVWEDIIRHSVAGATLLQIPATATAAHQAWQLARAWHLAPDTAQRNESPDVQAFAEWAENFEQRCQQNNWLDDARLADVIAQALQDGRLPRPASIVLHGFDELTPQQQQFIAALRADGCAVSQEQPAAAKNRARQLACADSDAEIRAAASWARQCLDANPAARIGIVAPDLQARRTALQRALDESLAPQRRLAFTASPAPYNISLGMPLAEAPLVHAALQALGFVVGPVDYAQVSALLRAPWFVGAEQEQTAQAQCDVRLRRRARARYTLAALTTQVSQFAACPQLATALDQARALQATWPARQTSAEWAAHFSAWLKAVGWPRGRSLDSAEHQALDAWQRLLGQFASLAAVGDAGTAATALARLRRLARETIFQPQTPDAPIEVLGSLEASGLTFDYLWVLGLHDEVWPAAPRPNPFLPVVWQRTQGIPHGSAAWELAYAQRITARFSAAAPDVIFSWPQRDNDRELRPSSLIADCAAAELPAAAPPLPALWLERRAREVIPETGLPVVPVGTAVRGGTNLLADQAACSFKAAAVHRWQARLLEQPASGLDARARGTLVHCIMAALWTKLQSRAALAALTENQRDTLITQCVQEEIAVWCRDNPGVLEGGFRQVEESRLIRLAQEFLQLELARGDFTPEAAETKQTFSIGGLQLHARPDRIDRLPDGGRLVIDYKTGQPKLTAWLGERPDAPQLPLYALANRNHLEGIVFAQLRTGAVRWSGITRTEETVPGVPAFAQWRSRPEDCEDFDALLDTWQRDLGHLAEEYRAGKAPVDPKTPQTCEYCHLGSLCRIDEQRGPAHDLTAEGDGNDAANE